MKKHFLFLLLLLPVFVFAQHVRLVKIANENRVEIFVDDKPFTQFLFPDSLEKPVLFPLHDAAGELVTRGFPLLPRPGEPTDHPHHIGVWFTYENVNGLDFWNNSFAIPADKKSGYGWIKTDSLLKISSGSKGILQYHANWVNQKNEVLIEENTQFEFSGNGDSRIIDRITELKADTVILLADAKDGLLGIRLAKELQIPNLQEQSFTDNKGNKTVVKKDTVSNGNYLTSEGKMGDSAWSTRAEWCKVFGKIGNDSVSIIIFDHPKNPNYPTFWHARGYGLFAANPLGEKIFTNGKSSKNLTLKKGETVWFRYRILIHNGKTTPNNISLNKMAAAFGKQ